MVKSFIKYIYQHGLDSISPVLIAVSGGRDSVALCELYHRAKLPFAIAHCNFGLRGIESDGDEQFVRDMALNYGVELFVKRFDTRGFAQSNGISIQMAARQLRVEWLNELIVENNFNYYATAHHLDDSIETYFINQLRGTGISGLHGILPKNGHLIHPLLFASRNDVNLFVNQNKLKWRDDSSNNETKYLRNKVRHNLIPLLEEINPDVKQVLKSNMERILAIEEIYKTKIDEYKTSLWVNDSDYFKIRLRPLLTYNQPETILFELIKEFGFNFSQTCQILDSAKCENTGAIISSITHELLLDRDFFIIRPIMTNESEFQDVEIFREATFINTPIALKFEISDSPNITFDNNSAQLDIDKLTFPLILRKWKQGDSFSPLGMKGRKKKVSDFLIDKKANRIEKENIWVITENGKIIWVVGHRIDEKYKITEVTKIVFQIKKA